MILLVAIVSSTIAARAQESDQSRNKPYALLFGTVWNAEGMPVYGVEVHIRRADHKRTQWILQSDHHGEFAQRVPPGTADYIVTAEVKVKEGKKKAKQTAETKVHIDNDERVDFGLHLTE